MSYELKNSLIKFIILNSSFIIFLSSCSLQKQIAKSANKDVLDAAPLQTAHIGISIYEPATNKYWYDYQGDKYFVPASNIKIPTCYAAMKYLGDSLVGLRWEEEKGKIYLQFTGDPSFLFDEFPYQPVWTYLLTLRSKEVTYAHGNWEARLYGSGWSWNDFNESYMLERSPMPIFGNRIRFFYNEKDGLKVIPSRYQKAIPHDLDKPGLSGLYDVEKDWGVNMYSFPYSPNKFKERLIPLSTYDGREALYVVQDSLGKWILPSESVFTHKLKNAIKTQPTDSILKPMMHRSDNFFAEQSLLMVSNERLGIMNDEKIIDTLLKTDLKDLPQKPRWVDGSGLSRYNLFTPKDIVFILNKMKNEFGMERLKVIFPTGGKGTLANYYIADSNYIYAKTGTLSGVVALSGYLYTKKGKELIFSVLVNNHQTSGTEVRRAVEKFLQGVRNKY